MRKHYDDSEAHADGDEEVNWNNVDELQEQIDTINALEDGPAKDALIKQWQEALNG